LSIRAQPGDFREFFERQRIGQPLAHQFNDFEHGHRWGRGGGPGAADVVELAEQLHGDGAGEAFRRDGLARRR